MTANHRITELLEKYDRLFDDNPHRSVFVDIRNDMKELLADLRRIVGNEPDPKTGHVCTTRCVKANQDATRLDGWNVDLTRHSDQTIISATNALHNGMSLPAADRAIADLLNTGLLIRERMPEDAVHVPAEPDVDPTLGTSLDHEPHDPGETVSSYIVRTAEGAESVPSWDVGPLTFDLESNPRLVASYAPGEQALVYWPGDGELLVLSDHDEPEDLRPHLDRLTPLARRLLSERLSYFVEMIARTARPTARKAPSFVDEL
jgi:hypothetical protein